MIGIGRCRGLNGRTSGAWGEVEMLVVPVVLYPVGAMVVIVVVVVDAVPL